MLDEIRNFPNACKEAFEEKIKLPASYRNVNKIIIAGMGGSSIVGDIISDIFDELKFPIIVSRSYNLPHFADEKTLLICISYSGNTKETLEQIKNGIRKKCRIVGISSNGKLMEIFNRRKLPFFLIKKSNTIPRVAIGYLLFSTIKILHSLGFIKVDKINIANNPEKDAKDVTKKINGTFPIIYSVYPSVAKRFKTQLNENSKIQARWEALPEALHNDIEAFGSLNEKFSLIFIRDKLNERKEIKKSIEFLKRIANKAKVVEIFSKGKSKLERILYLIWFVDFVSYFLAIENGMNPQETLNIKKFKEFVYGKPNL
jgi:glucose/mannose-6-phosphate isomerase